MERFGRACRKNIDLDQLKDANSLSALANVKQTIRERMELRWANASLIQKQILEGSVMAEGGWLEDRSIKFEFQTDGTRGLKVTQGPANILDSVIREQDLVERWDRIQGGVVDKIAERWKATMLIALIPLLILIAWCAVARGGLPYLLLGVHIVRQDGRSAGRWLIGLRSLLIWSPFLVLIAAIVFFDLNMPAWGALTSALHWSMPGLLLCYALIGLRWPESGPVDWLLGTRLVPA